MQNQSDSSREGLKKNLKEDAGAIKESASEMAHEASGMAREKAEVGKRQAAEQVDHLSEAIDSIASSLSEQDKEGLAQYAHQASEKLSMLADHLNSRSLDELTNDAKELARRKPAAFMLGSVALGFGLSRFVKASQHRSGYRDDAAYGNAPGYYNDEARYGSGTEPYASPASPSSTEKMDAAASVTTEYDSNETRPKQPSTPSSGADAFQ